eukprot:4742789-Amphidinium_carterae.1
MVLDCAQRQADRALVPGRPKWCLTQAIPPTFSVGTTSDSKAGGREVTVIPMTYYFPDRKFLVTVHVDDFIGARTKKDTEWVNDILNAHFNSKLLGILGPEGHCLGKALKSDAHMLWTDQIKIARTCTRHLSMA